MNIEDNITSLIEILSELSETRGVPRNVKAVIDDAIKTLKKKEDSVSQRVNTALMMLDEVSNDPNVPAHIRTQMWNAVSMLEGVKGQLE